MSFLLLSLVFLIFGLCLFLAGILLNGNKNYFEKNKVLTKAKVNGYANSHGSDRTLSVSLVELDGQTYSCNGLNSKSGFPFGSIVDVYVAPKKFGNFKYYSVHLAKNYNFKKKFFDKIFIGLSIGLFVLSITFVVIGLIKIL